MAVKFGVFVPQGWKLDLVGIADPSEQYERMTTVARAAEEAGFDSIWVYDHFHTVPVPTQETTFEAWTITAGLVRDTSKIRVGQMVTCNGYRHPALLAKMASTVDAMSNGRLICGLGAGWYEHEWNAYGMEFPDVPTRMGMFREACEIISRMWTEDAPVFNGKYYHIDKPINQPRSQRKPHPEFWLGGGGEKVTLKLVAKWADGCNIGGGNPDVVRQKPNTLPSWVTGEFTPELYQKTIETYTEEQLTKRIEQVIDAGATHVLFYLAGLAHDLTPLHRLAQHILPRFR
jgi:F420-dependent oxidoreductase-like protein